MSRDLVIGTNIAAMEAQRAMQSATTQLTVSQRALGSGSRVSDPSHDPSSSAVGLTFQSSMNTLTQGSRNATQASSMIQMFSEVLQETSTILSRLSSLAAQANNEVLSADDRSMIDREYQNLLGQVERNSEVSWGTGQQLLGAGATTMKVQVDHSFADEDLIELQFKPATLTDLGIDGTDITTLENAQTAQTSIKTAITEISNLISDLGAAKNQMDYTMETNAATLQGMTGAQSTFVDADIAESLTKFQSSQALFDMAVGAFQSSVKRAAQLSQIVASTMNMR